MPDVLVSSETLMERLANDQKQYRRLGMPNHAEGVASAVRALLRLIHESKLDPPDAPPMEPSE
jgi:hypothetical protein